MYGKIILNIVLAIILAIIQIAFISGLPSWFSNLNLILVVLVFILGLTGFRYAWWWSLGLGILLDVYHFLPFGIFLISLSLAILLTNFLLTNFFTNRSLYSFLALTTLAGISYKIILYFLSFTSNFFNISSIFLDINGSVLIDEARCLAVNIAAAFFIYYFLSLISNRLKPVFLLRGKK
ncbi:hypothetical protein DRH27_04425 [Candidatus Falkowbacteria bacterium]|nr:MAG: hypothetical protein DRH27_04425 [Candidatus Falkowbacteria bacterium]